MAEILSNRELLEGMTGGNTKLQSDLLNQPSDLNTLTNVLKRGATGLYSNIDNLTGNLADLIGGKPRVNILDRFSQIQNNNNLNEFEKAIQSGKSYFDTPSTQGGISQLLNLASPKINEALLSGREEAELKHQEYNAKQQAVGQYANGSMGDMIGEMFLATPIMKYGNMAKTTASLQAGDNALKTAKAISMDSIGNASTLGTTELLLGKAYGKSDEEAITNAVMAGAMGLAGTPLIGGAMKVVSKTPVKSKPMPMETPTKSDEIYARLLNTTPEEQTAKRLKENELKNDDILNLNGDVQIRGNKEDIDINRVMQESNNERVSIAISDIIKDNPELNIKYADSISVQDGKQFAGIYNPDKKDIFINRQQMKNLPRSSESEIILHELLHSKMFIPLEKAGPIDYFKIREIENIRKTLKEKIGEKDGDKVKYIFSENKGTFHEFVSEALAQEEYVKALKDIPVNDGVFRNMYEKFKGYILETLGISYSSDKNLFDRLVKNTDKLHSKYKDSRLKTMGESDALPSRLSESRKEDKYADIAFDEPASPVKQEVKPTKETVKTTSGRTVKAEEVLKSNKVVSNIEYDVKDPRADVGKPIEGQEYTPEINNPKKFSYGYDDRGRIYARESSALGPQGGATQKATLEQRVKPVINDALEEVNRRLEFYDNDSALRSRYGQTQAVYKKTNELSEAQSKANRLQFEKQQYKDIIKSEVGEIKKQAREKLDELNKIKIEDYKPSPKQIVKAQELFDKQTKVQDTNLKLREIDLKDEYKAYNEAMKESSAKDFEYDVPTKSKEEIKKKVILDAKIKLPKAKEAIREVTKKEKLAGRSFDPTDINDIQRKKYRDEIAVIEDIQGARADVKLLNEGKIDLKEFIYRARRRLEEQIKRRDKPKLTTIKEAKKYQESLRKEFDEIGVTAKDSELEFNTPPKGKETPEKKAQREREEITKAKSIHNSTMGNLKKYEDTRENFIIMSGPRKGQWALSKSQMEDIDREILSLKEIAEKTAPLGSKSTPPTRENLKDLKVEAKEKANLKTTQETRKQLGIKDNLKSEQIQFKDTLLDASNSVAQITTVLLSSKRLAKLSKLYGGKEDIREIVAFKMKDLLPENFPINPEKATVKPLFMTENYGQGEKGLIRNIQKANKVSKEEATQFFKAYEQAFGEIAPEMKMLRDVVYSTMAKNPKGEFSWTLPDGFKVEFQLKKKLDGSFNIKGNEHAFKIDTDNLDDFSKALMPNLIHSVDAYVARRMNKLGIATVHDAFQTPASKTDKYVQEAYGKIMSEINESNLLDNMLRELGYDGPPVNKGKLESSKIKESATKSAIEPEEVKGAIEDTKEREIDISKSNTPDEVMKEYMASGNVRESGFNQLVADMTNEAGYRTMSVAREGDDVFTHQVAMAHQSEKYNPSKAIKAPDGANVDSWNRVQEQIFNEARARLEYNPLTTEKIRGNHKFFTKDGKMVGDNQKTFNEILEEVKKADLETNTKIENITKENSKVFEKKAEPEVKETIKKSEEAKVELRTSSNRLNETIENWKAGYKSEGVYGQINKLHSLTRNALNQSAKVGQVTKNTISDMYKANGLKDKNPFDTNFQKSILDTDYISHKMSEKESKLFAREHNDLYQSLKSKIDQSAKGLKNKGDMNHPDYYPNAILLARSNGVPIEKADIIDKLISIKAMDDLDWKFIRENKDSQMFKELSSITETARVQTKELFKDDITKAMKGYRLETYDSLYKMKEGKLVPDVGDGMEQGALPNNLLGKKVGDRTPQPRDTKQTSAEYREQALEEGLGLVFDRSGNPMGLRKVASEIERDSMGRQVSAMETLSATLESNTRKLMQSDGVIVEARRMLDEGNDLFSRTPFKDSIKLTPDEVKTLPKEIQDILYVNKDFKQMLLGNKEIQIFKDGMLSVIEQIYKDGFVHFKQNVVLKNPASWVNNYMFGMVMNVNAGMSPKKAFQYSKQGPAIYAEMQKLTEDLIELELKGKLDSARGRTVKAKLESNEIYQMVQEGMAVSVMADLIKTSGKSHLFTDKAIGKGLRSIIGDKATDALSNIYIHSSSKTGRVANSMFTRIDVMHRYALAKHMLDEGANMKEAVSKSNGVYGDLDLISPVWSQAIQHYGFVPFSNWFFRISGGLQDTTRKNIARTIALSAGFYGLSEMTDKRTESWNPLLTLVNTPFDFVEMSPFHRPMNTIKNTMMPKVYGKVGNAISNEDPLSIAITENFK